MARKGFAAKLARRAVTRLMDRVGSKLVSGIADTSSDAPDARYKPKRDLYSKIAAEEAAEEAAKKDAE